MEESEEMGPKIETSITKVYNAPRILMGSTGMDNSNTQWKLLDGEGDRDTYQTVMFPEKFKGKPDVQVMLRGVQSDYQRNIHWSSVKEIKHLNLEIHITIYEINS